MNRLFEIAETLKESAAVRIDYRNRLQLLKSDLELHERQMIPVGGWPGKNADERKAAELVAKDLDGTIFDIEARRKSIQAKLEAEELRRDALIEERDAIRWTIRDAEQTSMSGTSVVAAWEANVRA